MYLAIMSELLGSFLCTVWRKVFARYLEWTNSYTYTNTPYLMNNCRSAVAVTGWLNKQSSCLCCLCKQQVDGVSVDKPLHIMPHQFSPLWLVSCGYSFDVCENTFGIGVTRICVGWKFQNSLDRSLKSGIAMNCPIAICVLYYFC